jgi:hypothetical protein
MGRGGHLVFETLDRASTPNESGLQSLDVVNAPENLILDSGIVARIKRGVTDDCNLAAGCLHWVLQVRWKARSRARISRIDPTATLDAAFFRVQKRTIHPKPVTREAQAAPAEIHSKDLSGRGPSILAEAGIFEHSTKGPQVGVVGCRVVLPSMDQNHNQKIFVSIAVEVAIEIITLVEVVIPTLVIEFDHRERIVLCILDGWPWPLFGIGRLSERKKISEDFHCASQLTGCAVGGLAMVATAISISCRPNPAPLLPCSTRKPAIRLRQASRQVTEAGAPSLFHCRILVRRFLFGQCPTRRTHRGFRACSDKVCQPVA